MSTVGQRIALWLLRDLSLRTGFREVLDQLPETAKVSGGASLLTYWANRIDEEVGDNRFIAALEKIRDIDHRGNRHESAYIAARALGPRRDEEASAAGVTQYVADGDVHVVQQDLFAATTQPAAAAPVAGPTPATQTEEVADI